MRHTITGLLLTGALFLAGCSCEPTGLDPKWTEVRQRLTLAEEPDGAQGVFDVRDALAAGEQAVTLVGRIGGMNPAFSIQEATFAIEDPSLATEVEHAHEGCTDANCPFCKSKKEADSDGVALIQFVDNQGTVLPVPVPELFDVDEGQMVVIRGRAKIDELGELIVLADGLYIRR